MNFKEWLLSETRQGFLKYLKEKLPLVPEYVLFDLFYRNIKNSKPEEIEEFIESYKDYKWELKTNFSIKYEIFDTTTIQKFKERKGGTENPYGVPNDKKRHDKQKELITTTIPKEPIILIKNGAKYTLAEGWHRTIQLFEKYPKGFTYPQVYIGTP